MIIVGEPKKRRRVKPAEKGENRLHTPISQVKRSNTDVAEDESGTKRKKNPVVPVAPKTAVKAKAKKPDKTPNPPKAEVTEPDEETAKAVKAAITRKGTGDVTGDKPPEDSGDSGDESNDDQNDEQAEKVRIKKAAHARFMRFSRSLKSFLTYNDIAQCLVFIY